MEQNQITATERRKPKVVKHRRMQVNPERKSPKAGWGGMFSRFRSGIPTGTTPHFKMWMADLNIKRALQGTTLASLVDRGNDPVLIGCYTLLKAAGFRTVYDLTQADARDLLQIKGIGPAKLDKVKADLASHQVAVRW